MHGVVSLLDERHYQQVQRLWQELGEHFGVGNPKVNHYPHFSYHIAADYDMEQLALILEQAAQKTVPFSVKATGLAIFTGLEPVLYVPVVRSAALAKLHERLWSQLEAVSSGSVAYYMPHLWLPHITLGHDDKVKENLGAIVHWLNQQALNWDILVDNLALIRDAGDRHSLPYRFNFARS